MKLISRHRAAGVLVVGTLLIAGCSSAIKPETTNQISKAELAVNSATQANATQYAPVELQSARNELSQAKQAAAREDNRGALQLAERATADAELAAAKAQASSSQQAERQLRETIQALGEQAGHNAGQQPQSTQ